MKYKILMLLSLILFVLCGCTQTELGIQGDYSNTRWVNVYYAAAEAGKRDEILSAEKCEIPNGSVEETVHAIFLQSCREPISNSLKAAIPRDVLLNKVEINDETVILHLSREYGNISGFSRTVADYCLTMSMCELEGIKKVSIFVDNEQELDKGAVELKPDDIVLSGLDLVGFRKKLKLYFPDMTYNTLKLELRDTASNGSEEESMLVLKALMDGPRERGLSNAFPYGTTVNSISTENDMCILDVSDDFIKNYYATEAQVRMCIRSIVDSLCEISDIEQVQILINGEKIQGFTYIDLSKPLSSGTIVSN